MKVINFVVSEMIVFEWFDVVKEEFCVCGEGGGFINSFLFIKFKIMMVSVEGILEGLNEMVFSIVVGEVF